MTLFVVATPIGNLEDLSPRARRVLAEVDVIACEDTRVTRKLLAAFGVSTPLERFDAHVERARVDAWVERIAAGTNVALVSDAGTPALSDPGRRLVAACRARDLEVVPIPGPSALTAALSASGLPAEPLLYLGFIARSGRARKETLDRCEDLPVTVALYESGPRLVRTLKELASRWPERPAVVARELTKRHETWLVGTLAELAERVDQAPKGELVVLIGPAEERGADVDPDGTDDRIRALLLGDESPRDIAARVARETGQPKRDVYQRVLALKGAPPEPSEEDG